MKRIKYTEEFEKYMIKQSSKKTLDQLLKGAIKKFNYPGSKEMLQRYLGRRQIRYVGYNANRAKGALNNQSPVGYEYVKDDGMVLIKTESGWKYKQRYIYEQYYGEIPKNHYVIFLDGDRTNFNINNLKLVSNRESSLMANYHLFTNDKDLTETGVLASKLIIKTREMQGIKVGKSHKKRTH